MTDGPRSALAEAVATMDRLRSPGGCPWDAAQTHRSLAPYLVEEAYETLEAIETDDLTALREELGDLLLQVLFHARVAQEAPAAQRFGIEDVAADLVAKLVRRHPHVFADGEADSPEAVSESWDAIKQLEKQRESVFDGVPPGQPALSWTAKLVGRAAKAGLSTSVPPPAAADGFGERLFALAVEAARSGVDPEQALRDTTRRYRAAVLAEEGQQ